MCTSSPDDCVWQNWPNHRFYSFQVENERNELDDRFKSVIKALKQSCGLKNALLEKQIVSLSEELEKAKIIKLIKEDAMIGSYEVEVCQEDVYALLYVEHSSIGW